MVNGVRVFHSSFIYFNFIRFSIFEFENEIKMQFHHFPFIFFVVVIVVVHIVVLFRDKLFLFHSDNLSLFYSDFF